MLIFKQSRCIALLVGVILVCFSSISLLHPGGISEGKQSTRQMAKLQSAASVPWKLETAAFQLHASWKQAEETEWFRIKELADQKKTDSAATAAIPVNTAAIAAIPSVKAVAAVVAPTEKKVQTADKKVAVAVSQNNPPTTLFFSRTKLLSQEQKSEATWKYAVSEEDMLLLQKIVMAEAEGEPYQGKVAVANVVLNRLRSANFPDTIKKVIYQKSQFSPVANGRLKRVKPNEDSINAVNSALSGEKEVTDDTYFFLSLKLAQDLTVHHSQEYAKTIGNHTFYK